VSLSDDLNNLLNPVESGNEIPKVDSKTRSGQWVAGVEWNGFEGTITTGTVEDDLAPNWDGVLRLWGLNPDEFDVVEPILFNVWGDPEGTLNRQWKGKVVRKIVNDHRSDIDKLMGEMGRYKPPKFKVEEKSGWLIVLVADWQTGKRDGDGLRGLVSRWNTAITDVAVRWKELHKAGYKLKGISVLCLGDLVEGCGEHYAMQTFSVELDRRDQVKVARRLLRDALIEWSKFAPEILVAAVGGNHGENRRKGKAFTTFNDNDDVGLVESVAEILSANPDAFGHIKFAIPRDELTLTLELDGKIIGLTHGHLASSGVTVETKLRQWMANQALGRQPIADADILVTGHYHHFRVADWGGVVWLQAPALDGGSDWWKQMSGQHAQAGVLTFVVSDSGVSDIKILATHRL